MSDPRQILHERLARYDTYIERQAEFVGRQADPDRHRIAAGNLLTLRAIRETLSGEYSPQSIQTSQNAMYAFQRRS